MIHIANNSYVYLVFFFKWDNVNLNPRFSRSMLQHFWNSCLRLEKIQMDFLWGGGSLEKKPHLAKWLIVCKAKSKERLGVRSLFEQQSSSLQMELVLYIWKRYSLEEAYRWQVWERRKGVVFLWGKRYLWVSLLKGIREEWDLFYSRVSFSVGNGRRLKF